LSRHPSNRSWPDWMKSVADLCRVSPGITNHFPTRSPRIVYSPLFGWTGTCLPLTWTTVGRAVPDVSVADPAPCPALAESPWPPATRPTTPARTTARLALSLMEALLSWRRQTHGLPPGFPPPSP